MTEIETFVKERNEALFSLDRARIEAYLEKIGESDAEPIVFWAGVYKSDLRGQRSNG